MTTTMTATGTELVRQEGAEAAAGPGAHASGHARPRPMAPGEVRWSPARSLWLLGMLGAWAWWGPSTVSLGALAVCAGLGALTLCLGHSAGLHRGVIHRSYRAPRWLERALVVLATLTGMGGPIGLMRMHELRDHWQNQPEAPAYYCYAHGPWRDFLWYLHMDHHPRPGQPKVAIQLDPRATGDALYRWLDRWWMASQVPLGLGLWALGGWGWVVWGVFARVALGMLGHWLVNYVAHTRGAHDWEIPGSGEQGRNSWLFGALSFGEGWHNNHHAWPGSARMGLEPGQLDLSYGCIRAMAWLGLIDRVQVAGQMPNARRARRRRRE